MNAHDILQKQLEDIRVVLKDHECLLKCLNEGGDIPVLRHCISDCPYKKRLTETLLETIQVLEESRKSFKSKQLEALRKKLTGILAETA